MSVRWETYGGKVEHYGQDVDEDCDGEIHPLHVLERLGAFADVDEEDVGSEYRRNDSPDTVESLREVDAQFRILRRATNSN